MKAWGGFAILVCALALAGGPPTAAAARPNYVVQPKSLEHIATLPATNGYVASIATSGHRQVVLSFAQGSYQISYTTLGRVTRRRITADFEKLGHVSLHFRRKRPSESRPPEFPLRQCKGRRSVEERGIYLGNVSFRGERGFSRIRSRRAKGQTIRSYRQVCKAPGWLQARASRSDDFETYVLSTSARDHGMTRSFLVVESTDIGLAIDVASLQQKVEGVGVKKAAFALDGAVFHLTPPGKVPVETKMVPTWPFLGSATYIDDAKQPATWTGSLGVRFPGSGQVSLAGPEFEAELCRAASLTQSIRCQEKVELLRPLARHSKPHFQSSALSRLDFP